MGEKKGIEADKGKHPDKKSREKDKEGKNRGRERSP